MYPYNKDLKETFGDNLAMFSIEGNQTFDDGCFFYMKSKDDDFIPIGMITFSREKKSFDEYDELNETREILKSMSIPKFGNIIYALTAMYQNTKDKNIKPSHDLSDDAKRFWNHGLNNNVFEIMQRSDQIDKNHVTVIPDEFLHQVQSNHQENNESIKDLMILIEDLEDMFWEGLEANGSDRDYEKRISYSENNFEKLKKEVGIESKLKKRNNLKLK